MCFHDMGGHRDRLLLQFRIQHEIQFRIQHAIEKNDAKSKHSGQATGLGGVKTHLDKAQK